MFQIFCWKTYPFHKHRDRAASFWEGGGAVFGSVIFVKLFFVSFIFVLQKSGGLKPLTLRGPETDLASIAAHGNFNFSWIVIDTFCEHVIEF